MSRGTQARVRGQRGAIQRHLDTLLADAPIRSLVASAETEQRLGAYETANTEATRFQTRYKRRGKLALLLTTAATVLAAINLFPVDAWLNGPGRSLVSGIQSASNIVALCLVWWIARGNYVDRWMRARADAEQKRGAIFQHILSAGSGSSSGPQPSLRERLDLIVAAHLDYQLTYFEGAIRRADENTARQTRLRWLGLLITFFAIAIGVAAGLDFLREQGVPLWPWLDDFASWLKLSEPGRWQLGLNTLAASLLAYASARLLMEQDERNRGLFGISAARLKELRDEHLPAVQDAAQRGEQRIVEAFLQDAQAILEADHMAWYLSRPPADPRR